MWEIIVCMYDSKQHDICLQKDMLHIPKLLILHKSAAAN